MPKRLFACLIALFIFILICPAVTAQDAPPPPPELPPMPPGVTPNPPPDGGGGNAPAPPPPGWGGPDVPPGGYDGPFPGPMPGPAPVPPGGNYGPAPVPPQPAPTPSPGLRPPKRNDNGDKKNPDEPRKQPRKSPTKLPPTENVAERETGPGADWAMFRGNPNHTGHTPEQLNYPLKLAWKHAVDLPYTELGKSNPSVPAVEEGVIYFCAGSRMYAVNSSTGSLRWAYPAQETLTSGIKTSPLIGEDLVYFGCGDGRLYAIAKDTGTLAWTFKTQGIVKSSPVLEDGVIYVGSGDNRLYALDALTGNMKWPGGFRTRDDVSSSPAIADGLIYFLSNDMVLYAAYTGTGKIKWMTRLGSSSRIASPVVADSTVYLAAGNLVQAFQAKSGRLKWSVKLSSEVTTVPALANGILYFGCRNGNLYALTTAGKLRWEAPVDLEAPIYGSPIVVGDSVVVTANKGIIAALNAETGVFRWRYTVMPAMTEEGRLRYVNMTASPVVSHGTLYALSDDGVLYAFRHDMPDNTSPEISLVVPPRDTLMPGTPPVEFAAIFADPGSGVREETISLSVDGEQKEINLIRERGIVWYKTEVTQPVVPLSNGLHTATLTMSDWAGNKTDMSWSFIVDNSIRRASPTTTSSGKTTPKGPISP